MKLSNILSTLYPVYNRILSKIVKPSILAAKIFLRMANFDEIVSKAGL